MYIIYMRYGDIIGVRANFDDTFNIIQETLGKDLLQIHSLKII